MMKQRQPNMEPAAAAIAKLLNVVKLQLRNLVSHFLALSIGLILGIIISFYDVNNLSSTFHFQVTTHTATQLPTSSSPSASIPNRSPVVENYYGDCESSVMGMGRMGFNELLRPKSVVHEMNDDELRWRASVVPRIEKFPSELTAKVAFMFLTRGDLPLAELWERFFHGNEAFYSIYVHSNPSFKGTHLKTSVFYGRWIPSKEVEWGQPSMIQAERRLLANALLDFSNQRFILLSESCIPLFNFTTIYNYLINSAQIHIEAYDLPGRFGRRRYRPNMKPIITQKQWRKGSQWFEMDRKAALEVVSDQKYFPLFEQYCRPSCISDEHYLATLTSIRLLERNSNRTLTWADWSRNGPHPGGFENGNVSIGLFQKMRSGSTCEYNGHKTKMCYLFGRKFLPSALDRLLQLGPTLMLFN